jgi:glycosyltransferase involved in cell wall biosynthesis
MSRFPRLSGVVRAVHQFASDVYCVLHVTRKSSEKHEERGGRRLTIVQYGDYSEAYLRLANGGDENYYGQKYTVDFLGKLASEESIECLTVISFSLDSPQDILSNGVRAEGIELYRVGQAARYPELIAAVKRSRPTHLIVMFPSIPLISWGIRAGVPVLPMFADSFRAGGLLTRLKHRMLALLLNVPAIALVANHNLAASLDLRRIGVNERKIVPFDWPAILSPRRYAAKRAPESNRAFRLIFVGALIWSKGLGDVIGAIAELRRTGRNVKLTVIGRGDVELFRRKAREEGVEGDVSFLGPRSHPDVISAMRDHDVVVVPSHWSYPEGLPMTLYEAMCTRTPLVISDHPMFALRLKNHESALVFAEKNCTALAQCVSELATSPSVYEGLSERSADAAEAFLCPLKYDVLISRFLEPRSRQGLLEYALAHHAR